MESDESKSEKATMSSLPALSELRDCIAAAISLTSPRDACRSACVSTTFRYAAESDSVWDRFLPLEYLTAISGSSSTALSKKELYLQACHNPVLIHDGKLSLWLDKPTGKKCYLISPKQLEFVRVNAPIDFDWISLPDARFPKVPVLRSACGIRLGGEISPSLLSPRTTYVAYLVFKPLKEPYGFKHNPVKVTVGLARTERKKRPVYLGTLGREYFSRCSSKIFQNYHEYFAEKREDGGFESELGEYFYECDKDSAPSSTIVEIERDTLGGGLVFQGIEIRPKKE